MGKIKILKDYQLIRLKKINKDQRHKHLMLNNKILIKKIY